VKSISTLGTYYTNELFTTPPEGMGRAISLLY